MLNDNWQKLIERLREAANSYRGRSNRWQDKPKRESAPDDDYWNVSIIEFKLYFRQGELVGWTKPQRTPLEPRQFDISTLDLQTVQAGWNGVFIDLKRECNRGINPIEKALVIRENGEPVGWFADKVKVGV